MVIECADLRNLLAPVKNIAADLNDLLTLTSTSPTPRRLSTAIVDRIMNQRDFSCVVTFHGIGAGTGNKRLEGVRIIGMGCINFWEIPSVGRIAHVNDIIVHPGDHEHQRLEIEKQIMDKLFEIARRERKTIVISEIISDEIKAQLEFIELTSDPGRKEINTMYGKRGFRKRRTGVFRFTF